LWSNKFYKTMITIENYTITQQIHESQHTRVYRGRQQDNRLPVILKFLNEEYPPPATIARFQQEYETLRMLDLAGVVRVYELLPHHNSLTMILEDFGGEALGQLLRTNGGRLPLDKFFPLACQIAESLGAVHQRHIIHKDINPFNIVFNPASGQLKIIDFGISTVLSRETRTFHNPNVLEGTLAYLSPEQTGRMNRTLDYRTDFYSLGATFYELLTGRVPFLADDPLELLHAHIAGRPRPPHELNRDVPPVLSDIILKLLAKNAEDRYQSAYGLKADLEECWQQWNETGRIKPFPLGRSDLSDRFQLPHKLYGREHEIERLLAAFERVSQEATEMMLVTGSGGIGKTALVQELYRPITGRRGYFVAGKFDQFQRNIPYSALIEAIASLARQLLMESEAEIEAWRQKLQAALGPNGRVITGVIPEVGLIIGPQPELPPLGPAEAQNRFNLVFQNFIQALAHPAHPLVIFLDDLQWADRASLQLLELLMAAPDTRSLFLIGAYRDNEVDTTHPLRQTVAAIEQAGGTLHHLALTPLDIRHTQALVTDTLHGEAGLLAELTQIKTGGNPFFIGEFLKSLYSEELLTFDYTSGQWQWHLEQIRAREMSDNVVELMAGKVRKLNPAAQQLLTLAACLGNQFDLATLAVVSESDPRAAAILLWEAITQELLLPLCDTCRLMTLDVAGLAETGAIEYKFIHDRVQQAAYSLILPDERPTIHHRIGQLLLRHTPPAEQEQRLFSLVNQLNQGRSLLESPAEREELLRLNLRAGRKAKAAAAYEPAFNYFQVGLELLSAEAWQTHYDLALPLHTEAAEAAYLSGKLEPMERLSGLALQHAATLLDKAPLYGIKIAAYTGQGRLEEAIRMGLEPLALWGLHFPAQPSRAEIMVGLQEAQATLAGRPIESLYDLPPLQDAEVLAQMRLLISIGSAAYIAAPSLFALTVCKLVTLSVRHGNSPVSAHVYAIYGLILCGLAGQIEAGTRFGRLALDLRERFQLQTLKAKIHLVTHAFIFHRKTHTRDTLKPLQEGYQSGLETGDFEYGTYCGMVYCRHAFFVGQELNKLAAETAAYSQNFARLRQQRNLHANEFYRQAVLNLLGQADDPTCLTGKACHEPEMIAHYTATKDRSGLAGLYVLKLMLCYTFEDYAQAGQVALTVEPYLDSVVSMLTVPLFYLYDSLTRLALYPQQNDAAELAKVAANQEKLKQWADHAPMNHLHKFYLVEAERARLLGQEGEARVLYDRAINLAREQDYLNEEALALELAGKFYMSLENFAGHKLGQLYLREARHAYQRWGAAAKVEHLEIHYPDHLSLAASPTTTSTRTIRTTRTGGSSIGALDVASILKAAQALSGEIMLDRLLTTLMKVLIENAGAEVGYLILSRQEPGARWVIEAEGAIDRTEVTVLQSVPVGEARLPQTLLNYIARTHEAVLLDDAAGEGQFTRDPAIASRKPKSVLGLPLLNQGRLIGILYLENNLTTGAFTPERLTILNLLSTQAAISIENAGLYTSLQSSERKYRTLFEDSRDMIFLTAPNGQILDVNRAGLEMLRASRENMLKQRAQDFYDNPDDRLRFRQIIEQEGAVRDFEFRLRRTDGVVIECVMTAALRRAEDGTIVGYQGIIRDVTERRQAEKERLRLTAMDRELALARDIQRNLLPSARPAWSGKPCLDHLEIAGPPAPVVICYSSPAREVGGDLYAYQAFIASRGGAVHEGKYALVVGDVTGKGMPAALLMAVSLASFRAMVGREQTPGELLAQMDTALLDYTRATRQNCAMVYVEITPPAEGDVGRLRAANAGLIDPLLRRADGRVEWLEASGFPLGIGVGAEQGYREARQTLKPGDLVLLVSDGVIEANNAAGEMFGFKRLEQAVAAGPGQAEAMLDHLKAELAAFVGDVEPHDDMTLVVVQV
jgi:PAS domain S-box-containing protein